MCELSYLLGTHFTQGGTATTEHRVARKRRIKKEGGKGYRNSV